MSALDIIDKDVPLLPDFREGDEKKQLNWVHEFLKRRNLSVRTGTRTI